MAWHVINVEGRRVTVADDTIPNDEHGKRQGTTEYYFQHENHGFAVGNRVVPMLRKVEGA